MSSARIDTNMSAMDHLDSMMTLYPELSSSYMPMKSHVSNKLYHQLTLAVLTFVSDFEKNHRIALEDGKSNFLTLYEYVIVPLEKKINPLSLARIASTVSQAIATTTTTTTTDISTAKMLLESLLLRSTSSSSSSSTTPSTLNNNNKEGSFSLLGPMEKVYLQSKLYLLILKQMEKSGILNTTVLEEMKVNLKKNRLILIDFSTMTRGSSSTTTIPSSSSTTTVGTVVDPDDLFPTSTSSSTLSLNQTNLLHAITDIDASIVQSAFYECTMTYRKCIGPPEEYYHEAMNFLHYTSLDTQTQEQKYSLATDLCLAALIGQGVYNLGDLFMESTTTTTTSSAAAILVQSLIHTPHEWLYYLLQAVASGHVQEFHLMTQKYATEIASHTLLQSKSHVVYEKMTLLALIQTLFENKNTKQSSTTICKKEKTFTFLEIASTLQIQLSQVEYVLIRAMNLGLIQGCIDQVLEQVEVTWVMPRTLNKKQIQHVQGRFEEWIHSMEPVDTLLSQYLK